MTSLAEVLRNKQTIRTNKKDKKTVNDIAETRIKLAKLKQIEDQRKALEEQQRIQLEKERREKEERDRLEAERLHKTIDFFNFDNLYRKIPPPKTPKYYGDNIKSCGTWIPHGKGNLFYDDQKIYSGDYVNGLMHGQGIWVSENGSIWEGEMKMGKMHGLGYYTPPPKADGTPSERKEALMRNNMLCCYHSDIEDGLEIEIQDPSVLIGSTHNPHVTIIHHKKGWIYHCRFHDEERPRQRNIDFSQLLWFKILFHKLRSFPLTRYGIEMDQPQTYDYWKDTYENPIRPYLGYAGSRPAANMKPLNTPLLPIEKRVQTDYTENEFESLEMGIGLSLLEKEREKLVEKKKQMWNDALAAKRKEEAELKEKMLAEEQEKLLKEATEKKQEKLRQKIEQENEKKLKVEAEKEVWKENEIQRNALRLERELSKKNTVELKRTSSIIPVGSDVNVWSESKQISESKLHKKVSRTISRVESRYRDSRKNKDSKEDSFEEGKLTILQAYVQFNPQNGDDDDIPLFQSVPVFLSFSIDSSNKSRQRGESILPLEEEICRTYNWANDKLKSISFHITAEDLDLETLEVCVYEDVKGRKELKLANGFIQFDVIKKNIGNEVSLESRLNENGIDKGLLRLTLRIKDTTIRRL